MATDDRQAEFLRRLDEHRKIVFKVAQTYCRQAADRDELAQEIVYQLWRAFPRYDARRSFSTWMYRIALNVAISRVRTQGRRRVVPLDMETHVPPAPAGPDLIANERIENLMSLIERLDRFDRALLLLYLEERSYREIAEVLGITETNVATKLSRLKQRLSDQMSRIER